MRRTLALLAIPTATLFTASVGRATCPVSVPVGHGYDSYFACQDVGRVAALAELLADPTTVNTGTEDILCEAFDGGAAWGFNLSFSSPEGAGSGVVSWTTVSEVDVQGFNVVVLDRQGQRIQVNDALIPCHECTTWAGSYYEFIMPKHKSGRGILVEVVRLDQPTLVFGPATRIP